MASLVDRRIVFVMGKGGTGKSTVAAALGVAAAARGKRVLICEVAGRRRVYGSLTATRGPADSDARARLDRGEEVAVGDGMWVTSLEPETALEQYLRSQLPSRALFELLRRSRVFQYLVAAAPGSDELLTMGKIWETAQLDRPWTDADARYDLVIVDSPATGHGLALMEAPRTYADLVRGGRIRRQADRIDAFVRDHETTAAIAVALPEEMPVAETLELAKGLRERLGLDLSGVVANAVDPTRFTSEEITALDDAPGIDAACGRIVAAAVTSHRRAEIQRGHVDQLSAVGAPVIELPALGSDQLTRPDIERLAAGLEGLL